MEHPTPILNYNKPARRQWNRRPTRVGFFGMFGFVAFYDLCVLSITHGADSMPAMVAWWAINFVSFPAVAIFVMFVPPPFGEGELTPWDYTAVGLSIIFSCVIWGLIGAMIANRIWGQQKPYDPDAANW